jgi:DNA helicase-2/ATP-dependent DNA helicase PcrA
MAVSAVPGSGKTLTLALMAAKLIIEGRIGEEGEVLVVTVQNSAVDNISQRIRRILSEQKLPPAGYHVCTLHKLASDILHQRFDLAGVEDGFFIIDDGESRRMMHNAAEAWIAGHRAWWQSFLPDVGGGQASGAEAKWREETEKIGRGVAKLCKHWRKTPKEALDILEQSGHSNDLARMGIELYAQYVRYLQTRSGLDFDDLIWRAIDALDQDVTFRANLRQRWPHILEDEAQDSSPLQEQILVRIAGEASNWVRVGDPNQAINSTFTSADPRYFRDFFERDDVQSILLPQSGRCARPIIALANALVHWGCHEHPEPVVREMAFRLQDIEPTDEGDPQPNPPDDECHIHFPEQAFADVPAQTSEVARWAASYARRYPERTVAILCPAAWQGNHVVESLEGMSPPVPYDDLLKSTPQTRHVAKVLAAACHYLGMPTSPRALSGLYGVLAEDKWLGDPMPKARIRHQRTLLRSLAPHELLFPRTTAGLAELLPSGVSLEQEDVAAFGRFAKLASKWVRALALPVDQLLLTIAQDLFDDDAKLAICHTIAVGFRGVAQMHPIWRLTDFASELSEVARNRRALSGISLTGATYVAKPGTIVVTTMHKAKGLEWDAVYLMCVDSLEFPDTLEDTFRDELYFLPGRSPAVETNRFLEQLMNGDLATSDEGTQLEQVRLEYIAERLRLLYVGITRAKRDLAFTWSESNGRRHVRPATAALALRDTVDWQKGGGAR